MFKKNAQKLLSSAELSDFFSQMSMILHSGISVLEGLTLLLEDAQNNSEIELLQEMISEAEISGSLYSSASASGIFPHYALEMIHLGEETGTLDEVCSGLSDHYRRESSFQKMLRSALLYPSFMIIMMILVVLILITKVLPIFAQVFGQLGQEMSGFSAGLLNLGVFLSRYALWFLCAAVLIFAVLFLYRKKLPLFRSLQELLSICRLTDGLAISLKSGLSPEQGLSLTEQLLEDPQFLKKMENCRHFLEDGEDLSVSLQKAQILQGTYARIASIAEKTGALDNALKRISDELEDLLYTKISRLIAMLEPTFVILLSIIVGAILFSVMFPLLGIMASI